MSIRTLLAEPLAVKQNQFLLISFRAIIATIWVSAPVSGFGSESVHRLSDLNCQSRSELCSQLARTQIENETDPIQFQRNRLERSRASRMTSRAPIGTILIHGLYAGEGQFRDLAETLDDAGVFTFQLALPGHWGQQARSTEVGASEWIEELRRAIALTAAVSDRIVLIGQSTGGLLAINASLESTTKSLISGLVLLEPAVRVRHPISFAICAARYFGESASDFPNIREAVTRQSSSDNDKQYNLHMGCEVSNLRRRILLEHLPAYEQPARYFAEGLRPFIPVSQIFLDQYWSKRLGELINVPTLLFSNLSDDVVSVRDVEAFFDGIPENRRTLFRIGGISHGVLTHRRRESIKSSTLEFLKQVRDHRTTAPTFD